MKKLLVGLTCLLAFSCTPKKPVDTIFYGGPIYTANQSQPVVEAVGVSGDSIVFAGSLKDAEKLVGEKTQRVDLKGKTMTPGFIESHGHFMGLGQSKQILDLMNIKSYDEMVEMVRQAVAKAKPGQWILGRGWHQDKWTSKPAKMIKGFQTHELLSAVSPNNPVFLSHASGHAGFANARAMQIAGVNLLSPEALQQDMKEGGEIIRDALGNPTGIFNERSQQLVTRYIQTNSEEMDKEAIELAMTACLENGITSFHDAGAGRKNVALFESYAAQGKLKTRLYVMLTGFDPALVYERFARGPQIDPAHWLTIRSVKLNCDGALGSRGAWLLEPYTDRPDFYGMATLSMDTVLSVSRAALKAGFQVCSHAIGDRANREILDRYEQAFNDNPEASRNARFRIEHAQHIDPSDIPRFGKLGVIAAMQAIHLSSDRPWAIDRLGEKRIREGAYMWQSLLKTGAHVTNGTDVPVEPVDPIASFFASVTRQTLAGQPVGGYEPAEKMTREQALHSYTLDAAYGEFEEGAKGSIEPGKLADFTIFSQDIMKVPDEDLLKTRVEMTVVGGKILYTRKQ